MKILFIGFLFLISICFNSSFSQYPCNLPQPIVRSNVPTRGYQDVEIRVYNQTFYWNPSQNPFERVDSIKVKIFPIGAFYNRDYKYSPKAINPVTLDSSLAGKEIFIPPQGSSSAISERAGNWDGSNGSSSTSDFAYGYGRYKFEFYRKDWDSLYQHLIWIFANYVYIDFRDLVGNHQLPSGATGSLTDMRIDYFSKDTITFQFDSHYNSDSGHANKYWHINLVDKEIRIWDKFGTCIPPYTPDRGVMIADPSSSGAYLKYPLDANQYNGNIGHVSPGELGMNLSLNHNVTTRDTLISNPESIIVTLKTYLKIDSARSFNMITPTYPTNGYTNLVIQDSAYLILRSNSNLTINSPNRLTLKRNSTLKLFPNSEIIVANGGVFCNEGAEIVGGPGKILFKGGATQFIQCAIVADYNIKDSAKIIVDTNAVLHIPDSTTLHFTGNETSLIMRPNSKLKLGVNSKILFENGARLIANNAEFSSVDSTKKWLGISLNDLSQDTIKNCTIKNAKYGISIADKYNASESPYFSASIPDSYTHGIYMEY